MVALPPGALRRADRPRFLGDADVSRPQMPSGANSTKPMKIRPKNNAQESV